MADPFDAFKPDEAPQVFDAVAIGSSFRQLAIDLVPGEKTDFVSRWFRSSSSDADLVVWTDSDKRVVKHQLSFFGQIVEWNPVHGTRTGAVIEEELSPQESAGEPPDISETIRFDRQTQNRVVHQAISLLSHVPDLSDADRSILIFNLRQSPKMHKNARERALELWGSNADELHSTVRPGFWKRLRNWMLGSD